MPSPAENRTLTGRFIEKRRAARRSTSLSMSPHSAQTTIASRTAQWISRTARQLRAESYYSILSAEILKGFQENPMTQVFHRNFFLDGPAGRLEAMLWTTSG